MSASRLPAPHGPSLLRNPLSFLGWMIATVSFFTGLVLIVTDIIWFSENVYNGIITYMIVPAFLFSGLALVAVGVILEWRRRRRAGLVPEEQRFPHLDLNLPRHRKVLTTIIVATTLVVAISAVGGYQAYHFTESVTFCGEACHKVMTPEFTAYQGSPHARVTCVQCHIGPGANAYVKSKASGLRQVWKYNLDTFELPVAVPIANLRPARETCEQCHWPEKFSGDFKRVFWYFAADEENTARAFHLLMKVGGASTDTGRVGGIHWHVSREDKVEYWASDAKRTSIPWVRVTYADGRSRVYRSEGAPEGEPPAEEIRTMDCMDCHNRPSHIYYSPKTSLQKALVSGRLDRRIPRLYGTALELLSENYPDKPTALAAIEAGLREVYADSLSSASLEATIAELSRIYQNTFFPEQGVDWRTYPNHIGHMHYPGCDRCHDNQHVDEHGASISNDCNLCHDIIAQPSGEAAFGPVPYVEQPFEHPGGEGWEGMRCSDCHAAEAPPPSTLMLRRGARKEAEPPAG
ncbi:NapC/NirT family cytochrome c [bacterium]|nr:NapC/NirT family cytochrome c [bacterium]